MQVEIDGVHRHRGRQAPDEFPCDAFEGIRGDQPAGAAAGPEQGDELVLRLGGLHEAGNGVAGAAQPGEDVLAPDQRRAVAMGAEIGEVGVRLHEAIGLVKEAADGDAGHVRVLCVAAWLRASPPLAKRCGG